MADVRDQRICLGAITGAQGVRGEVVIKSYTQQPEDIGSFGPLTDRDGRDQHTLTGCAGRATRWRATRSRPTKWATGWLTRSWGRWTTRWPARLTDRKEEKIGQQVPWH